VTDEQVRELYFRWHAAGRPTCEAPALADALRANGYADLADQLVPRGPEGVADAPKWAASFAGWEGH